MVTKKTMHAAMHDYGYYVATHTINQYENGVLIERETVHAVYAGGVYVPGSGWRGGTLVTSTASREVAWWIAWMKVKRALKRER